MSFSVVDHYNTDLYERMRELECSAENGMTLDELYRAEADLALDHVGVLRGPVLDVGCGTGRHALVMSAHLPVAIRGIDVAPGLIALAQARARTGRVAGVSEALEFEVADVRALGPSPRLGAVTCLGDSFGHHTNADTRRVLASFFSLLEPGGRMVLQFRERDPDAAPLSTAFTLESRVIDGAERQLFRDPDRGDAMYEIDVDCPLPDPADPSAYVALDDRGLRIWRDLDGWEYAAFVRVYVDAQGQELERLPPVWMVRSFTAAGPFAALQRVLEAIGFQDVRLVEGKRLGTRRNLAVVATR